MVVILIPVFRQVSFKNVWNELMLYCLRKVPRLFTIVVSMVSFFAFGETVNDSHVARVKTILDKRCVVCHGCYDAPCQLKLSSYEGLLRGAIAKPIYNPSRLTDDAPTRLFVDGNSRDDWHSLSFHDVANIKPPLIENNKLEVDSDVLWKLISQKNKKSLRVGKPLPADFPLDITRELSCPKQNEVDNFLADNPSFGMPYGMTALPKEEQQVLEQWMQSGYPDFDSVINPPPAVTAQVERWETFFNNPSPRKKLVARYLYEHLFLGHLAIADIEDTYYFRLIRSSMPSGSPANEIATRRPNDSPGAKPFYYRLIPIKGTILDKTHIVYQLDEQRRTRWQTLFFSQDWDVVEPVSYTEKNATNPFLTFSTIPSETRYRFLLDDVQYFIDNFIKGPVCRGQVALNVINDYFFVAFLSPEYDLSVVDRNYLKHAIPLLDLPSTTASPMDFAGLWFEGLHTHRRYLEYRDNAYRTHSLTRAGLPIEAIWNGARGDGTRENGTSQTTAQLTVFRHFDSASVSEGFVGDRPNTVWVVDYPTLERIYYDLVVNYDVFASVSHQMLTRMYMDYLRMETESLFLSFLPITTREPILKNWYQGALAQAKVFFGHTNLQFSMPSALAYNSDDVLEELIHRMRVRSSRPLQQSPIDTNNVLTAFENINQLSAKYSPWLRYLPELSYVLIHNDNGNIEQVVSLIVNRAHTNVSFIFGEDDRRLPAEDTMLVVNGSLGSYPNFIFWVNRQDLKQFSDQAGKISSEKMMTTLVEKYGIRRTDQRVWKVIDKLTQYREKYEQAVGILDISRYANL